MTSFKTLWLVVLYLFVLVNSNHYSPEKCEQDNCSLQLQPFRNESCFVHKTEANNTEVCFLSNFTQGPVVKLESEEDAKFSVFITPYTVKKFYAITLWPLPAINVSFVIHKEGVDALAIKIEKTGKDKHKPPICRVFDFRSSKEFLGLPVTFYYDCLHLSPFSEFQHVQIDMISLPSNEHLTYYVYIPFVESITNPCDWKPLIMVFCNTLIHRIVKIKFSQAPPQQLNISFYSVELVEKPSNKTISLIKSHNKAVDMLTAEFLSVPSGNYVVIVKPSSENCLGTVTDPFQVGNPIHVLVIITVICICAIILFIIGSLAVYKFYILPRKLKGEQRNSSKSYRVDPEDSKDPSTRSSNEDNEDSASVLLSSSSSFSESDEDLKAIYEPRFI